MATREVNRNTGKAPVQRGDTTALQQAELDKQRDAKAEHDAAVKAAADKQENWAKRNTVVDYSQADQPIEIVPEEEDDDSPTRDIVVKYTIEKMTYGTNVTWESVTDQDGKVHEVPSVGQPRYFDFQEGRKYRVPTAMAKHMEERGLVAH